MESWPHGLGWRDVWESVEGRFTAFLPNRPCGVWISAELMKNQAACMFRGVQGFDSWTVNEVKALPQAAWESFLLLFDTLETTTITPLLMTKRRTPIEKTLGSVGGPESTRPIDVYSVLLRLHSTCMCLCLKDWAKEITHPSQTATHGGILAAQAQIAAWTEATLVSSIPVHALSIDLTKMFNMISPEISCEVVKAAGLEHKTAQHLTVLTLPLRCANSIWKLPSNAVNPTMKSARGLP